MGLFGCADGRLVGELGLGRGSNRIQVRDRKCRVARASDRQRLDRGKCRLAEGAVKLQPDTPPVNPAVDASLKVGPGGSPASSAVLK